MEDLLDSLEEIKLKFSKREGKVIGTVLEASSQEGEEVMNGRTKAL